MRIELKKRDGLSSLFSALSPFIALGLTLVAGVILFLVLGKIPSSALQVLHSSRDEVCP